MKVLEVNCNDLPGRIFNGYDLHIALNQLGYDVKQIVRKKYSNSDTVKCFLKDEVFLFQLVQWEKEHSINHVMMPLGQELARSIEFQEAELVHYHILHNNTISLLDYPELMRRKCSIWTIHDPWILTGNCIHPLECDGWKTGCGICQFLERETFLMQQDNTAFMWYLKRKILSQINPHIIVASAFMKKYIEQSPLTKHFDKIDIVPFGVILEKYNISLKSEKKRKLGVPMGQKVISFRADDFFIKGCKYFYEALGKLDIGSNVTLICVGTGTIPKFVRTKYQIIELGWANDVNKMIDFFEATDIFVMPSLAEGFGMMSIEAMAAGCVVVCFKTTTIEEITNAPECGIAVKYKSSEALAKAIQDLLNHWTETERRGKSGRELVKRKYQFKDYVERHRKIYESVYEDSRNRRGDRKWTF